VSAVSRTPSDLDLARFTALGFTVLRGWLDDGEVDVLRAEAEQALRDGQARSGHVGGVPMRFRQVALTADHTPFSASLLADDGRFLGAAAALLARPVLPMPAIATRQTGETGWHSDNEGGRPATQVAFVHYFEPLTAGAGALRFLPATHTLPGFAALHRYLAVAAGQELDGQVVATRPGDIVAFDARVVHGSFGGATRLRYNLLYQVDPQTDEEVAAHRATLAEWTPIEAHPGAARYPLYRDWLRNGPRNPRRAAVIARLEQLDLLPAPPSSSRLPA